MIKRGSIIFMILTLILVLFGCNNAGVISEDNKVKDGGDKFTITQTAMTEDEYIEDSFFIFQKQLKETTDLIYDLQDYHTNGKSIDIKHKSSNFKMIINVLSDMADDLNPPIKFKKDNVALLKAIKVGKEFSSHIEKYAKDNSDTDSLIEGILIVEDYLDGLKDTIFFDEQYKNRYDKIISKY